MFPELYEFATEHPTRESTILLASRGFQSALRNTRNTRAQLTIVRVYIHMRVYIYVYIYICVCVCVCVERGREVLF
jgi:hypothetical protein